VTRMRAFNQDVGIGCVISGRDAAIPSFADIPTAGKGLCPYVPAGQGYRAIGGNEPVIVDLIWAQAGTSSTWPGPTASAPCRRSWRRRTSFRWRSCGPSKRGSVRGGRGDLYETGLSVAGRTRFAGGFMGAPGYNTKFIGHGVGIEVDEIPFIAKGMPTVLVPGMVFTLEPKFVFPGEGAVGIENTYLVTPEGHEKLTVMEEEVIRCGG